MSLVIEAHMKKSRQRKECCCITNSVLRRSKGLRMLKPSQNSVIKCTCKREYPKVSGLAAWRENCKWYSYLPVGAVISLFCESVQ
jgi:hypothetical protein